MARMLPSETSCVRKGGGFASKKTLLEEIMRSVSAGPDRMEQLVERLCRSNVTIETKDAVGSGVILPGGGHGVILTARHVVADAIRRRRLKGLEIRNDGRSAKAVRILAAPHGIDLALVELDRRIGPAAALSPGRPRPGAPVIVIGAGMGIDNTVSMGIVSKVLTETARKGFEYQVLQTDAAISPGNSGGGVFSAGNGGLIAITSYKLRIGKRQLAEGGFAITAGNLQFLPAEDWKAFALG